MHHFTSNRPFLPYTIRKAICWLRKGMQQVAYSQPKATKEMCMCNDEKLRAKIERMLREIYEEKLEFPIPEPSDKSARMQGSMLTRDRNSSMSCSLLDSGKPSSPGRFLSSVSATPIANNAALYASEKGRTYIVKAPSEVLDSTCQSVAINCSEDTSYNVVSKEYLNMISLENPGDYITIEELHSLFVEEVSQGL
ncbi:hypothetical protein B0J11DRAFT_619808 [Dendryphion nanum]|uniref:Uncharacterized protein n=1 Tax=Dendryphion nanum TaxID=256645 RepID=A0A9P9D368_9PLEO|nr:hypothetical protein B0J11DRAFT_619808 [Dendryphion nanum]